MPYTGLAPESGRSDLPITYTTSVTSVSSNFDTTVVVLGYANENTNTGMVKVYEYNSGLEEWTQKGSTKYGPSTNAYFGTAVDMDWDGERILVGSNATASVYVYDWDGSDYQNYSNIIQSPSGVGSDFGFSLGIAKNNPDVITIGSPAHNNVFVYELISDTWTQTFSNIGTDIQNLAPYSQPGVQVYDTSTNLVTNPEYNRYGESVSISNRGDHIVVGQPGTALSNLNATNTTNFNIVAENQKIDGNVVVRTAFYTFTPLTNLNKQLGSVRVFKTNDAWSTSNTQVGSIIYGERNFVINENRSLYYNSDVNRDVVLWANVGWGFPAHGSSVDINEAGDLIVVGAPLYGFDTSYGGHSGKVYTYTLIDNIWVELNTILGNKLSRYGINLKLDFVGTRLAVNGSNNEQDILGIYDLSGESWYEVVPKIVFEGFTTLDVPLDMKDGQIVIMSRTTTSFRGGTETGNDIDFHKFELTQAFAGNSLFSGYVAAQQLYIGANDSLNQSTDIYSKSKRISFGGTFNNNTYEDTLIENRIYSPESTGLSELILSKVPLSEAGYTGLDILRLKGMEIHLDSWNQLDGDRYDHHPILVMTQDSCIGIGHLKTDFTNQGNYYLNSVDTHAILDVNGSGYIRNKLNVNYDGRSEILGYNRSQGALFWDTRQYDTVDGTTVYSRSWPAPSKFPERYVFTSTMNSTASYSKSECAFVFDATGTGVVDTDVNNNLSSSSETPKISLWIKLKDAQSAYTDKRFLTYGNPDGTYRLDLLITTSGIQMKFVSNSTNTLDATYTFASNKWYHIFCVLNRPQIDNPSPSTITLYINNVLQTLSGSESVRFEYTGRIVIGGGIQNACIGMVNLWKAYATRSPTPQHLYDNGPPDELLSVGGTATIQNKLGIGLTDPTEALEVSGNVHANYFVGDGSELSNITLQAITDYGNVTSNTVQFTNTGTSLVTSGNVGVGVTNPTEALEVSGRVNFRQGATPMFEGILDPATDGGRSQLVLNSNFSDLIIASSALNDYHGSTLTFVTSDPSGTDYEKFVINQGNWGTRSEFLDFDWKLNEPNPHLVIGANPIMSIDGNNRRIGINRASPLQALDVNGNVRISGNPEPQILIGPNTIYNPNTYLRVGSGQVTSFNNTTTGYTLITNGNLHLDPVYGYDLYLCFMNGGRIIYSSSSTVIHSSDDRLKTNERIIDNAIETLNKLRPQTYFKSRSFENMDDIVFESGLIAQEIYYKCPELRHLVHVPKDASPVDNIEIPDDPQIDPDYSSWGNTEAGVSYSGIIPYLISAIQELDKKNKALETQLASVLARLDALENSS